MRLKRLLSLLVLSFGLFGYPEQALSEGPRTYIPMVTTLSGYGSATVVQNNVALTAWHVVKKSGGTTGLIVWRTQTWAARVWTAGQGDDADDWAVLVTGTAMTTPVNQMAGCADVVGIGDAVTSAGLQHDVENGRVVTLHKGIIYHTALVIPGDSGGPLYNQNGKVIGMNIGYIGDWSMAIHFKILLRGLGQPCQTEAGELAYLTNPDKIVQAIRYAEGVPSYGNVILAKRWGGHRSVPEALGREATSRYIHRAFKVWVRRTRPHKSFIRYLGETYAPIGASNDPTGLNHNWVRNVERYLGRGQ